MNYGFVIDNRKCIGCHACSTACKSENEVPLGVQRTWVKTVEHGTYPDVTRSFHVTRCNHCENPPCVRICPTTAMYQRADGIVEFDRRSCIGCKSCIQACPYDAIYIDPETKTAAKCHFCSHRTDIGLEPACVVVCPVHAIIAGDLDDPQSEIAKTVAAHKTSVRKPEQGTAPKLLYIEGGDIALHPTVFDAAPTAMATVDVVDERGQGHKHAAPQKNRTARSGAEIREPSTQGVPSQGPLRIGKGRFAEQMVQLAYNAQHKIYWHWQVPAYLVTKGLGAGALLLIAIGSILGLFQAGPVAQLAAAGAGLVGLLLTTVLLVADLEQPKRFLYILLFPQWKSWLVRGAFLLIGASAIATARLVMAGAEVLDLFTVPAMAWTVVDWVTWPLAIGAAVYTAFLFAQAEGRDLWQSPLLPFHLVVQSLILGGAALAVIDVISDLGPGVGEVAIVTFTVALILDLFVTLVGELAIPHASEVAARAAHEIRSGRYRGMFWGGAVVLGHLVPVVLLWVGGAAAIALAAITATIGLYLYEHAFVMAPQEIPNS
ncbi:MAG: polysulfide reductase NrfD [Deltaproteobacteria bacterium]|nr:polysulfide reductase NrfD [Deltaproteobacteria bacterium]